MELIEGKTLRTATQAPLSVQGKSLILRHIPKRKLFGNAELTTSAGLLQAKRDVPVLHVHTQLRAVASSDVPSGVACGPVGSGPPCPSLPVGPTPVTPDELLEGWQLVDHDSVGGERAGSSTAGASGSSAVEPLGSSSEMAAKASRRAHAAGSVALQSSPSASP